MRAVDRLRTLWAEPTVYRRVWVTSVNLTGLVVVLAVLLRVDVLLGSGQTGVFRRALYPLAPPALTLGVGLARRNHRETLLSGGLLVAYVLVLAGVGTLGDALATAPGVVATGLLAVAVLTVAGVALGRAAAEPKGNTAGGPEDGMDRRRVRQSWEALSERYASSRPTDGNDVDLLDDLAAELPPDPRVLDVGCGDGARTLANLPDGAVGLDFARAGLDLAAETVPAADLVQGDMTAIPLADDTVDAVTAYHAVFHVAREDHPTVYREFARVLRPGGLLLTTVGRTRSETVRQGWLGGTDPMLFSTPGRETTREQLEAAGFEVRWERYVDDPLGSSALFFLAELPGDAAADD